MLALAGLLAYLWWAGLLTDQLRKAATSLTTPPERKPGAFPGISRPTFT